ncbi:Zn-dependent oxidoreductase [Chitinophaga alhagiae]|uniref:Zn-dependent oxidoreductase n=1 Tax=Chitinophaga alhagiae TaxID=2203219 RepID=UPI000E5A2793|nr:Zn-dependent oxidoreductase [Chitinophaga alhagiae]
MKTTRELSCKLTSPALRERKATVLASLKKKILSRQELDSGYRYNFQGHDEVLDELVSFIKSERQCCDFFEFRLAVAGDGSEASLEITGPDGAKAFIETELGL